MAEPLELVLFGATGDLAFRKIHPALASLCRNHLLRRDTRIIAVGRAPLTTEHYHARMAEKLTATIPESCLRDLQSKVRYLHLDPSEPDAARHLRAALDASAPRIRHRLFYLAVPPSAYAPIIACLEKALDHHLTPASRIVVEKPFGRDLASARELDQALHRLFPEDRVFRIDHYMAKETVQNILLLRFANLLFEPVWNRTHIDHVEIVATETLGVGHRAKFYDQTGVLRDMFQNHMMMLLALCAMEPPALFQPEQVRDERSKVFRALKPLDMGPIDSNLVLGQYGPGSAQGQPVPGYRQEPGVPEDSVTPTFAWMRVFLDNWRWQGVPFHLCSGKRLARKQTEITIYFKKVPISMFGLRPERHIPPNRLVLGIHPDEVVRLDVQTKGPGATLCPVARTLECVYGERDARGRLDDYAKVLLDCILGDQTLFWRQDAVELCWQFLTPILDHCACPKAPQVHIYPAGGNGPPLPSGGQA